MSALVTGANGGLGAAIALALARAGRDVAVHYRGDRAGAATTVAAVQHAGRRGHALHADLAVTDPAELDAACEHLLDAAQATLEQPLEVVVLNAFPQQLTPWADLDSATWDAFDDAGTRPTRALLRAAAARLSPGGVIVTIGSIEGYRTATDHLAYGVAKAALHHLTAGAAHELGPRGIRVVGVAPGLIERDRLEADWPEGVARWRAVSALGRPVTAAEVAAAVAFLASPAASGITGTTLVVDAGWSASPGW